MNYQVADGYKGAHWNMDQRLFCVICGHNSVKLNEVRSGSHTEVDAECTNCKARSIITNSSKPPWYGSELTKAEVEGIFALAKIEILDMKQTANGYHESGRAGKHGERQFWHYWWMVKTKYGWIEIGWRKRVISIDWRDTKVRVIVPSPEFEGRTRSDTYSHAYSVQEAITDLTFWNIKAETGG